MTLLSQLWLCLVVAIVSCVHGYKPLSENGLDYIRSLSNDSRIDSLLKPLLIPRVSGTEGNAQVRDMIVHHFTALGWTVELDTFTDDTPFGKKTFSNIIVTKNPSERRRVILAAHYDSKHYDDFEFIGATDSAVPCAILMDLAYSLDSLLLSSARPTTLQLVFFDGEEAFVHWTATDSIYGARHLAAKWESERKLRQIEALVLLDLLGTGDVTIPNYHRATSHLYNKLVLLEKRLAKRSLLSGTQPASVFNPDSPAKFQGHLMQDDHTPFFQRGVDILHVIPYPFPSVWHTAKDNADCIDPVSVYNYALLFRAFVAEYLELDPFHHSEL